MADSMTYEPCLGADLTAPDHQHRWNNLLTTQLCISNFAATMFPADPGLQTLRVPVSALV